MLDLYERRWQGRESGPREYAISSDERTSVQARCRYHPSLAPGQARMMRVNHEYERGGALAHLAAYVVGWVRVFGRCAPSTGIVSSMALVEVFFSVVQREVVSPNDFTDLAEVEQRLADFESRYNTTARPFR